MLQHAFFKEIVSAAPANRAEVGTQVLLRLFHLLGFSARDRADKPSVPMRFGHKRRRQRPDFIFYAGAERSFSSALVAVEARAPTEALSNAGDRALAYADWAGTPLYLACNGHELAAVQVTPGLGIQRTFRLRVREVPQYWARIFEFLGRTHAVLFKEALQFLTPTYLPGIERLPPGELFQEYLDRLSMMFPATGELPALPLTVTRNADGHEYTEEALAGLLSEAGARLVIEGSPGAGKSTLARRLITHLTHKARGTRILPVYMAIPHGIPGSLPEAFTQMCETLGVKFPPALLSQFLQSARVVLVLDGLDEAPEPEAAVDNAIRWLGTASNLSVCITSRPSALEELHQTFQENAFQFAHVRQLTEAELEALFQSQLKDRELTSRLLRYNTSRLALRTPLMALIAVRVATTHARFEVLSDYELIRDYVQNLNGYLNSQSTPAAGAKTRLTTLLDVLADAAIWLRSTQRKKNARPSLRELRDSLEATHGAEEVEALLNTGLISASGGRVEFLHESFGDFAIAFALLRALRAGKRLFFNWLPATDNALRLAHSALQGSDEAALIAMLEASWDDTFHLRRVTELLRLGCSERALRAMWRLFRVNPKSPLPAWEYVAPSLIQYTPKELRLWLVENWKQLPTNKLRWIVKRVAKEGVEAFAPWLLAVATQKPSLSPHVFQFIRRHQLLSKLTNEAMEIFSRATLEIFSKATEDQRREIGAFLLEERHRAEVQALLSALLLPESALIPETATSSPGAAEPRSTRLLGA
jgi:hypothetical protein